MKMQRGFSLIELMVTVAIIGVLAATAIPAFIKYTHKAKTAEARQNLKKIYDGARQYYLEPHYSSVTNMQPVPPHFPDNMGGGDAVAPVGFGAPWPCCSYFIPGTAEKCPLGDWWETTPHWRAIHFSISEPHYYTYIYDPDPPLLQAPFYPQTFTAVARGNLDCDAIPSWFAMYGFVDPVYGDGPIGTSVLQRIDELE
jgi:prepilin-type N-terminal cleavage/methylation domain-containing protein